jgi:predicted KAP-like P-loop ATPase
MGGLHSMSAASIGFHGDRPLEPGEKDWLGFDQIAERLAKSIQDQTSAEGLVIGIEGEWGSGKSSLINLIVSRLKPASAITSPEIIGAGRPALLRFQPWLVGRRDELLNSLFSELATTVQSTYDPNRTVNDAANQLVNDVAIRIRKFAQQASKFSPAAALLGELGVPLVGNIAKGVDVLSKEPDAKPLAEQKQEIEKLLRRLPRRIVVIIDDLDRLDPQELAEILRLVRAVADFPNIVYILSYDDRIVAQGIKNALQVEDGHSYIQKIVQVGFSVPTPDAFDLRRWARHEIAALAGSASEPDNDAAKRLDWVLNSEGGRRLTTPRDVVRVLNAIRLYWPAVKDDVDLADLVWLQLVKNKNPLLYDWAEQFAVEHSQQALGATITDEEKLILQLDLGKALESDHRTPAQAVWDLHGIFPSIKPSPSTSRDSNDIDLFAWIDPTEQSRIISARRLASPEHSRFYFAFQRAAGTLGADAIDAFLAAAGQSEAAVATFIENLGSQIRPQGGNLADLFFDRLVDAKVSLTEAQSRSVMVGLANTMDNIVRDAPLGEWGKHWVWDKAEKIYWHALSQVGSLRKEGLENSYKKGHAVGWLMSILRDQMFAHGVVDPARLRVDRQYLTKIWWVVSNLIPRIYF